jgi:hypothetical protein
MLRRNALDAATLRAIELALEAARPSGLADDRRDAIRWRVMSRLGPQSPPPTTWPELVRRRWVAAPAAVAIAGLMLVAAQLVDGGAGSPAEAYIAHADGNVEVNGQPGSAALAGDVILARSTSWLSIGPDVRVAMAPGATLRYNQAGDLVSVAVQAGDVTVASASRAVAISQPEWQAAIRPSSVATFSLSELGATVNVAAGEVQVSSAGQTYSVTSGNSPMRIPAAPAASTATPSAARSASPSASPSPLASPGPSSTSQPPVYVPSPAASESVPTATPSATRSPSQTPLPSASPTPTDAASTSPTIGVTTPPSSLPEPPATGGIATPSSPTP